MRIVGIPARYGSRRFPGKPLANLGGKPVIRWVVESALKVKDAKVIVATDDERIKDAVRDLCEVILTPSDLPSGTDRLAYALRNFHKDIKVVNLQGDEPFIKPSLVERIFEMMEKDEGDIYTLAKVSKKDEDPSRVKVVLDKDGYSLYFSRYPIPYGSDDVLIHIGIYGYTVGKLLEFTSLERSELEIKEGLEQLRALYHGWKIKVGIVDYDGISIDTPEDLKYAEKVLGYDT